MDVPLGTGQARISARRIADGPERLALALIDSDGRRIGDVGLQVKMVEVRSVEVTVNDVVRVGGEIDGGMGMWCGFVDKKTNVAASATAVAFVDGPVNLSTVRPVVCAECVQGVRDVLCVLHVPCILRGVYAHVILDLTLCWCSCGRLFAS